MYVPDTIKSIKYTVILFVYVKGIYTDTSVEDIDTNFVTQLRDDVNLDLSTDTEYEDLRAELLASHTVLAKLVEKELDQAKEQKAFRRSLGNTPCWNLGGVCINAKLCVGNNFLTEVPGCKDKQRVCCFVWNKFNVRDMTDKGFNNLAMPWSSLHSVFGKGGGVIKIDKTKPKKIKLNKSIRAKPFSEVTKDEKKIVRIEKSSKSSTESETKEISEDRLANPFALIIKTK